VCRPGRHGRLLPQDCVGPRDDQEQSANSSRIKGAHDAAEQAEVVDRYAGEELPEDDSELRVTSRFALWPFFDFASKIENGAEPATCGEVS